MRSISERIAKLKSDVESFGDRFDVSVYDDESEDPNSRVMWMEAEITEEDDTEIVYVELVQFNDNLFFAMPEARQDKCANALLKKFIKYYKEHYDGTPVGANFANYDLQEKFKVAVEKGIFPKESLKYIISTNKEAYKNSALYNMKNRKLHYLIKTITNDGGEVKFPNSDFYSPDTLQETSFINVSIDKLKLVYDFIGQTMQTLYMEISDQKIAYGLSYFPHEAGIECQYDVNNNTFYTEDGSEDEDKEVLEYLKNPNHPFYASLGSRADTVQFYNTETNEQKPLKEFLNNITASKKSRLKKMALIGNLSKNDIDIQDDGLNIWAYIKNEDKKLHQGPWEGEYVDEEDESKIGIINHEVREVDNSVIVKIPLLEIRKEYKQTLLLKYMLDYFMKNVLDPLINQYGKENIFLTADFENEELGEMLNRVIKKKGLQWDFSANIKGEPIETGSNYNIFKNYDLKFVTNNPQEDERIINSPLSEATRLYYRLYDYDPSFDGVITTQGDVIYCHDGTWDMQGYINSGLGFHWEDNNLEFNFNCTIDDLKQLPQNALNNMETVFNSNDNVTIKINNTYEKMDFEEFINELESTKQSSDNTTASKKSRLKYN